MISAKLPVGEAEVRSRLAALPDVQDVDLSGLPERVRIRFASASSVPLAAGAVRALLRQEVGIDPEVVVEGSAAQVPPLLGERLRFQSIEVSLSSPGILSARTVLERQGVEYAGEADGEMNPFAELRVSATATLRAVENAVQGAVTFDLLGVKEIRVFDHDMAVVLLSSPQFPKRKMIGIAVITHDRRESAGRAVLNATNRTVGKLFEPAAE